MVTTNENCDESGKTTDVVEEQRDEECKHSEPTLVVDDVTPEQNGSNDNGVSSEVRVEVEAEAEDDQTSLGGDDEQLACVPDAEEAPSIERRDTEDSSGVGSVDSSAAGTQGSSAQATIAVSVTTSKTDYTDCTDDGILRDDEGNPVDLAEAEENMLRDDEGNIIDPKTLVTKESYLELCCECDEYCEPGSDSAQNESEIDEDTYVRFTIEAIVSEMVTHVAGNDENCNDEDYTEPLKEYCNKEASATDETDDDVDPSEANDNVQPTLGRVSSRPKRNGNASGRNRSRQVRWGIPPQQQGADDTVHIMFNNKLSTLDEEASCINDEDSAGEAEDEKSSISHNTTRSEKFIKARWDYSLQVMNSETSTAQLIDARDEIDYMIQPKLFVPDDRSVCSDEGTI